MDFFSLGGVGVGSGVGMYYLVISMVWVIGVGI